MTPAGVQGELMSWSKQQSDAITAVRAWLEDRHAPQVFRLFGYAGTGKTTIAKEIAHLINGTVLFGAFTGKAALVLRTKGCDGASTIHSMIYKVEDDESGKPTFKLNRDSDVGTAKLVIIDECSMVGPELGADLLSFGTRVLVLGDPAQLPPVKGTGFFIDAKPDFMLTDIHRQAADNPIIRMSMDVREGRRLQLGRHGDSRVVRRGELGREELAAAVMAADQVLCGINRTRRSFNARLRELHGMAEMGDWRPVAGDRLICLRNNKDKGLLNGSLWDLIEIGHQNDSITEGKVESADGTSAGKVEIVVPVEFFKGAEDQLDWKMRRECDEFDYGYAITVHKSQGSQYDDLVVFDESGAFRDCRMNHLYTAITRAAERITVVV